MQKGKLNTKKKKKYSFVKCSRNSLSRRIIEWTRVKQSREDDRLSNVHSDVQLASDTLSLQFQTDDISLVSLLTESVIPSREYI